PLAIGLTAAAYFIGSIPFALILGKARGVDIRTVGSGNVGATNLSRALGRRWGITAFVLDFLKGFVPAAAPGWLAAPPLPAGPVEVSPGWWAVYSPASAFLPVSIAGVACALAAIIGHVFPIYLRFRGGKGVATSFGAVTALAPLAALA